MKPILNTLSSKLSDLEEDLYKNDPKDYQYDWQYWANM